MTDAVLGVQVNVKGAKEGKADLDAFANSAKGAATASKELTASQQKAMDDLVRGTGATASIAAKTKELGASATATGAAMGFLQRIVGGVKNIFAGGIFGGYAAEGLKATEVTHGVRNAVHLLGPVAMLTGNQISGLREISVLARTGLVGLAAGITAIVVIALEQLADKAAVARQRLQSLLGDRAGGGAFAAYTQGAQSANMSTEAFTGSIESLVQVQGSIVAALGGTAERYTMTTEQINKAGAGLSKLIQMDGKTASDTAPIMLAFFQSLAQNGKITLEAFDALRNASPGAAAAIARAFGSSGDAQDAVRSLREQLQQTDEEFESLVYDYSSGVPQLKMQRQKVEAPQFDTRDFLQRMSNLDQTIADSYTKWMAKNKTVSQSFDQLKTSILDSLGELGKAFHITSFVDQLAQDLKDLNSGKIDFSGLWQRANQQMHDGMESIGKTINDWFNSHGGIWGTLVDTVFKPLGDALTNLGQQLGLPSWMTSPLNEVIPAAIDKLQEKFNGIADSVAGAIGGAIERITSFISDAISKVSDWLSGLWAKIKSVFSVAAQTPGATEGVPSAPGPSFPVEPSEATGGVFQVRGAGGVDSVPVRFMASPGEKIAIIPSGLDAPRGTTRLEPATTNVADYVAGAGSSPFKVFSALPSAANDNAVGVGADVGNQIGQMLAGMLQQGYDNIVSALQVPLQAIQNEYTPEAILAKMMSGGAFQGAYNYSASMQTGGSFVVPGSGGPDSTKIGLKLTPKERVTVTPPDQQNQQARVVPSNIVVNVFGAQTPERFAASENAIRRTVRRAFG